MVGALLHKFSMIGYITQILMAIAGYILYLNRGGMIIFIIPLIILILLLFSENLISKKMNNLKKRMGSIDEVSKEDPKRKQFNSLHKWSVKLFLLNELLCLPLFYIILVK
jgi:membrane protein insertase Oxa1/YidC/SpoIIIJ